MTKTSASFLLAGLMAVAGFANAQNTGAAATNTMPAKAGEASTMTQGVPNAAAAVGEKTRADVKAEATAANKAGTTAKGTTGTSDAKGAQAGQEPKATDNRTRAQRKADRDMQKARKKADKSAAAMNNAGTSTNVPAGNPSPAMGQGTAK